MFVSCTCCPPLPRRVTKAAASRRVLGPLRHLSRRTPRPPTCGLLSPPCWSPEALVFLVGRSVTQARRVLWLLSVDIALNEEDGDGILLSDKLSFCYSRSAHSLVQGRACWMDVRSLLHSLLSSWTCLPQMYKGKAKFRQLARLLVVPVALSSPPFSTDDDQKEPLLGVLLSIFAWKTTYHVKPAYSPQEQETWRPSGETVLRRVSLSVPVVVVVVCRVL